MDEPIVSVVMVVSNVERFLAEAIESILGQTFKEFEFVIVDFGSTDRSASIAASYAAKDRRIKLHEVAKCGLAEARSTACSLARGRYIAIMDADDVCLPERLKWEVEFLEKHPEVGVVGGAVERVDATGAPLPDSAFPAWALLRPPLENCELQSALLKECIFAQPTVLMRRDAFEMVGGYRPVFAQAEDYDLWLRIAEHFQLANLKQVVLKYRIHTHQLSLRKRKEQTFATLAAKASAAARRNGNPDPFNGAQELTPAVLARLGVNEAQQQSALCLEYKFWIRSMRAAGEWSAALNAALEMLQSSDWKHLERSVLANMHLTVAGLYWQQKKFLRGSLAVWRAVMTRPMVAGHRLKPLLRRFRLVM